MKTSDLDLLLSEHFNLQEFLRSGTAIRRGIDNRPELENVIRMQELCINVLEPLRKRFGAIRITSGYRCELLNEAVKGVKASQHVMGEAADIYVSNKEIALKYFNYVRENLDFDQMIWEPKHAATPRWLHISYSRRHKNRHQCL